MANPATISFVHYGWETTFGTATTTSDKTFGHGIRVTTLNRKNNIEPLFTCGARNAQKLIAKKFEGAATIEFALANPWWFRAVMGTVTSTGTNPTTHTFTETDTIPSITIANEVSTDTASIAKLLGCKVVNCVITAAVGEIARGRLDFVYANESHSATTTSQVSESLDVFTFAHGALELPNGTTIAEVQNAEITIANNPEMMWGLGSRLGQQCPVKNREYSARATIAMEASATLLEKLYGGASGPEATDVDETATMELVFDNGQTSANQRQISLLFTGVQLNEHNMPQDPTTAIMEDVPFTMRSVVLTAKNATTVAP